MEVKKYAALEKDFSYGNKRLWIRSRMIRFDGGRHSDNPDYRHKEINLKTTRQVAYIYLLKHKTRIIFNWLVYTKHSRLVLLQLCMLPFKVYAFSEQGDQTPIKTGGPGDPECLSCSLLRVLHPEQPQGCWLRWSNLMDDYSQNLTIIWNFSGSPKDPSTLKQQEAV